MKTKLVSWSMTGGGRGSWFRGLILIIAMVTGQSWLAAAPPPTLVGVAQTNAVLGSVASLTINNTVTAADNRLMLVAFHYEDDTLTKGVDVTGASWVVEGVSQPMTRLGTVGLTEEMGLQLWAVLAPTVGVGTVSATLVGMGTSDVMAGSVMNFADARQALDGLVTTASGTGSPSIAVSSRDGHLTLGFVSISRHPDWQDAPGQTGIYAWSINDPNGGLLLPSSEGIWLGGASQSGVNGSRTFSWSNSGSGTVGWVAIGLSVSPVAYELGGTVWRDNGVGLADNGVLDAGEPGVANVQLELRRPHPISGEAGVVLATTTSDAQGNYRFVGLEPGDFVVLVTAGNFGSGAPLAGLYSSGTAAGLVSSSSLAIDGTDDGLNAQYPARTGVRSDGVTLGDADSMALDFGFATPAPTAVGLAYFHGRRVGIGWEFEWRTLWEDNALGFDLVWMGPQGLQVLNDDLVPAENSGTGGWYQAGIVEGGNWVGAEVWLRETELDGGKRLYGPARIFDEAGLVEGGDSAASDLKTLVLKTEPGREVWIESTTNLVSGEWVRVGIGYSDGSGVLTYEVSASDGTQDVFYRAEVR